MSEIDKIDNLKEFYTRFCSGNPLQEAQNTNLSVINDDIALVSIQSTHKNMIHVRTTPVIKVDGQWKIVNGIYLWWSVSSYKPLIMINKSLLQLLNG